MVCNTPSPACNVSEVDSVPSTLCNSTAVLELTTFSRWKTVAWYQWISCVQLLTVEFHRAETAVQSQLIWNGALVL